MKAALSSVNLFLTGPIAATRNMVSPIVSSGVWLGATSSILLCISSGIGAELDLDDLSLS